MESFAHLELKRLAVAWLKRLGCQAIATEVRCPISKYRVDVAGWLDHADGDLLDAGGLSGERPGIDATLFSPNDRSPRRRGPARPRTIVVECKQSRTDFTRDDRNADRLKSRLESLKRTRRRFEEDLIPRSEPHLRESGSSLFRELERWDFEGSRTTAYRRTLKTIERLERRLHGDTKFHTMFGIASPTTSTSSRRRACSSPGSCRPGGVSSSAETSAQDWRAPSPNSTGSLTERVSCSSIDSPEERRHAFPEHRRRRTRDVVSQATRPQGPESPVDESAAPRARGHRHGRDEGIRGKACSIEVDHARRRPPDTMRPSPDSSVG